VRAPKLGSAAHEHGLTRYYPVARTLDVIGDRWTTLILRDLMVDCPRKLMDFQYSLPRISPTTHSDRLKSP